jgi:hypothetical protein
VGPYLKIATKHNTLNLVILSFFVAHENSWWPDIKLAAVVFEHNYAPLIMSLCMFTGSCEHGNEPSDFIKDWMTISLSRTPLHGVMYIYSNGYGTYSMAYFVVYDK